MITTHAVVTAFDSQSVGGGIAPIGLVQFQRKHIIARSRLLVQNRKYGLGQPIGEIGDFLAHLADPAKPTAIDASERLLFRDCSLNFTLSMIDLWQRSISAITNRRLPAP